MLDLNLYLVTDVPERCRLPLPEIVEAAIDGGVSVVQYRSGHVYGGALTAKRFLLPKFAASGAFPSSLMTASILPWRWTPTAFTSGNAISRRGRTTDFGSE